MLAHLILAWSYRSKVRTFSRHQYVIAPFFVEPPTFNTVGHRARCARLAPRCTARAGPEHACCDHTTVTRLGEILAAVGSRAQGLVLEPANLVSQSSNSLSCGAASHGCDSEYIRHLASEQVGQQPLLFPFFPYRC